MGVEWQAAHGRCIGCPFVMGAAESEGLPHCSSSSLTAWNNTVLTGTWCLGEVDEEEEKTVEVRGTFSVYPLIRGLTQTKTWLNFLQSSGNMVLINHMGDIKCPFKCFETLRSEIPHTFYSTLCAIQSNFLYSTNLPIGQFTIDLCIFPSIIFIIFLRLLIGWHWLALLNYLT